MAHKYFISKGQCFVTGQKLGILILTLNYSLFSEDVHMKTATIFCMHQYILYTVFLTRHLALHTLSTATADPLKGNIKIHVHNLQLF